MATKRTKNAAPRSAQVRSKNPLAAQIVQRFKRAGESSTLERMLAELGEVARYDIVAALKELEKAGEGQFSVGHAGKKTRFVWATPPVGQGRKASGVAKKAPARRRAEVVSEVSSAAAQGRVQQPLSKRVLGRASEEGAEARGEVLEHFFHLRSDFFVKVLLPTDVTRVEMERFCQFLQAIPFGSSG